MSTTLQVSEPSTRQRPSLSTVSVASPAVAKARPTLIHVRVLQAIAILMVVYAHAVVPGHHFTDGLQYFDSFVRTCTVPLFIAMSGYLYCYSKAGSKPVGKFLSERANRLLLPYVFLSTIAFVIKANLGSVANRRMDFTWQAYAHQLLYPWDNAIIFFWYIPTLLIICVASVYLDRWIVQKNSNAVLPLLVCLAAVSSYVGVNQVEYPVRFLNLYGAANYLFYFWAGYALNRYEGLLGNLSRSKWLSSLCLACAIAFPIAAPEADFGLALAEAAFGCFSLFIFAKAFLSSYAPAPLLTIGDASYQIYLLSWFFQTLPIIVFCRYLTTNEYIVAIVSMAIGISGPLLVTFATRKLMPAARPLIGLR